MCGLLALCKAEASPTPYRENRGFTLVELIIVIVVLSILALGTTRFIVQSTQQYTQSADRAKLVASGRVAVEKVTRRLRNALPNSIRVSGTGQCIEYFPVLAASSTLDSVIPATSSLDTASFSLTTAPTNYAVIAAFDASELFLSPLPSPGVIVRTNLNTTGVKTAIPLNSTHTFSRTSPTDRVYVVGNPERFCVTVSGNLTFYSGYGIPTGTLTDAAPGSGSSSMVAEDIATTGNAFTYTVGTLERNALVTVALNLEKNGDPVNLVHEVQIRNVP